MNIDHLGNPVFNEKDLFDALYQGHQLPFFTLTENSKEIEQLKKYIDLQYNIFDTISKEDFDRKNQNTWFMPDEYKDLDIEGFLVHVCPKENYQRLIDELQEFRERNMLELLRWLKYFVDTCRKNGILWGVGRGSSVSSYVLYLIGVHKIDPIKYNLDWREFLR